jgi:DNA-binding NarL/FixJ family response regulator
VITVLIVSNLPAVRAGLTALVAADEECRVVGAIAAGSDMIEEIIVQAPDIALLDLDSPDAVEIAAEITEAAPATHPLLFGPVPSEDRLAGALLGRAWGYIPRDATGEEIITAVHAVAGGLIAVGPMLAAATIGQNPTRLHAEGGAGEGDDLTPREKEVLQFIALGLPNKTIAGRLGISEHTVKFHVASLLSKLGASSRTEAVLLGARRGLVVL